MTAPLPSDMVERVASKAWEAVADDMNGWPALGGDERAALTKMADAALLSLTPSDLAILAARHGLVVMLPSDGDAGAITLTEEQREAFFDAILNPPPVSDEVRARISRCREKFGWSPLPARPADPIPKET